MLVAAKAPQVQVPPVVLLVEAQLPDTLKQHVITLLALAGTHQLADAGDQQISGSHSLAVVVETHIESLDLLGIVGDEHRLAKVLLRQELLVLGLQVAAPAHFELKLIVVGLQNLHRVRVADPDEIGAGHMAQPVQKALIHKLVAKLHVLGAGLQHIVDDIFDGRLDDVHVIGQVGEGHLRLDHPELRGMALGVGALRPEGGAEGVHLAEGHGHTLRLQLAGYREGRGLLEEVLLVVDGAVLVLGQVLQVQGSHLEHLPRALAVAASDDGGVSVDEAILLEEFVNAEGRRRTHPVGRAVQVGAGPQVGNGAQELHCVAFFLQGVFRRRGALHHNLRGVDLKGLLGLGGLQQSARNAQGSAHILGSDLLEILDLPIFKHHLHTFEGGAVVQVDKAQGFGVPDRPGPAADGDGLPRIGGKVLVKRCYFVSLHTLARHQRPLPSFPFQIETMNT